MNDPERTRGRAEGVIVSLLVFGLLGLAGCCAIGFFVLWTCGGMTL